MKLLFEFLPVLLFFIAFKAYDIFIATGLAMAVSLGQISWLLYRKKQVEPMQWISFIIILLFGSLTIVFHNEQFIKLKPTVLYWTFALILILGKYIFKMNFIRKLMGNQIQLKRESENKVWGDLNIAWISFLVILGALNLYVASNYSSEIWNNFKLSTFGILIIFVIVQGIWISKHIDPETIEQ